MGGFVGLNYQSVAFVLKMYPVDNEQEVFSGLQLMEFEVLKVFSERAAKK